MEAALAVVIKTIVPSDSALKPTIAGANFFDAYSSPLTNSTLTPTEIFLRSISATPRWVDSLMSIRNVVVRQLGLKDVGAMRGAADKPASAYRDGDQIGIFRIFSQTDNELILGINDRHLDVRVSVLKPTSDPPLSYIVSTVVTVNNWLGHIYMVPVGRIHPLVVKAVMRRTIV